MVSIALTTTGSGSVASRPSRRARQTTRNPAAMSSSHSPGSIQRGSSGAEADLVVAGQVVVRRDVPDQVVVLAEQPQRHGGVVGAQHLVVGQRLAGAEQHRALALGDHRGATVG